MSYLRYLCCLRIVLSNTYRVVVIALIVSSCILSDAGFSGLSILEGQDEPKIVFYAEIVADITTRNSERKDTYSSCILSDAGFSGLSILDCPFGILLRLCIPTPL
jgi:hypothetical protein